jgi:hypothetical protein
MRAQGILEIKQAHTRRAGAMRQPDQVFGVVVAVAEDARTRFPRRANWRPDIFPFVARRLAKLKTGMEARQPFEEQIAPGLERDVIVGQQRPGRAVGFEAMGRVLGMQSYQDIGGGVVQRRLVGAALDEARVEIVAEVLEHGKAGGEVAGDHTGRRKTQSAQIASTGDESVHATGG